MTAKRHKIELALWLLVITLAVLLTSTDDWREGQGNRRGATAGVSSQAR
jgi:hypothetical protein